MEPRDITSQGPLYTPLKILLFLSLQAPQYRSVSWHLFCWFKKPEDTKRGSKAYDLIRPKL